MSAKNSPAGKKRGRGRPQTDFDLLLPVFEKAIIAGYGITEALEKAGIKSTPYYDWLVDHPEYAEKIRKLKGSIADIAENAIERELNNTDPKFRTETIELAKWVLKKRKAALYGDGVGLPAKPAPQIGARGMNLNFGTQTLVNAEDLTDTELQRLAKGEAIETVLGDRTIATAEK